MQVEMVKYQTTEDIWGFSWNGRRKDSDYQTLFALNDKINVVYKDTPFASLYKTPEEDQPLLLNNSSAYSDQNLTFKVGSPSKAIKFNLDGSQRMK